MHYEIDLNLPPGDWSTWSSDEWVMSCPFCGKEDHFTWNVVKNVGRCWVCEKVIPNKFYFNKIISGDQLALVEVEKKEFKPNTKQTSYLINAWDNPTSRLFLIGRNVDEYLARKYDIRYNTQDKSLIVDISSISPGMSKSYLWRKLPKGKWFPRKGTSSIYYAFGWEKFENSNSNVLICEGIFDLLSSRLIDKGIAMLGSHVNQIWFHWFKKHTKKLVLWFDPDSAGDAATLKLSEQCLYFNIPFSVIKSKKNPKDYDRRSPKDLAFLKLVEKEIEHEQNSFSRRYTFGG